MSTILIIDDEIVLKIMLRKILSTANYNIITAENGVSALASLAENRVDLVITDLIMPEMDGLAFLRDLRANKKSKDLPVIVLTGAGAKHLRDQAWQIGANAILTKPIGSQELLQVIDGLLAASTPAPEQEQTKPRLGWIW
jgi:DNA-binding response OmpR family regulator